MDRTHSLRSRNCRFAPRLEALEERRLMACKVVETAGVLTITGDNKANVIAIVDDGTTLSITCDGKEVSHSDDVTSVVIDARGSRDTVSYQLTGDLAADTDRSVSVNLGNGKDTFNSSVAGNLLDGARLDLGVAGGNGKDELTYEGAGDIATGAALLVRFTGGNAQDRLHVTHDGQALGDLIVRADGGLSRDVVQVNLTVAAGSTGRLNAQVFGSNGKDVLTLRVVDNSGDDGDPLTTDDPSTLSSFVGLLDGGSGYDCYRVTDNIEVSTVQKAV